MPGRSPGLCGLPGWPAVCSCHRPPGIAPRRCHYGCLPPAEGRCCRGQAQRQGRTPRPAQLAGCLESGDWGVLIRGAHARCGRLHAGGRCRGGVAGLEVHRAADGTPSKASHATLGSGLPAASRLPSGLAARQCSLAEALPGCSHKSSASEQVSWAPPGMQSHRSSWPSVLQGRKQVTGRRQCCLQTRPSGQPCTLLHRRWALLRTCRWPARWSQEWLQRQ